jgi:hypothetical protein
MHKVPFSRERHWMQIKSRTCTRVYSADYINYWLSSGPRGQSSAPTRSMNACKSWTSDNDSDSDSDSESVDLDKNRVLFFYVYGVKDNRLFKIVVLYILKLIIDIYVQLEKKNGDNALFRSLKYINDCCCELPYTIDCIQNAHLRIWTSILKMHIWL